jgi:hypothetical protein
MKVIAEELELNSLGVRIANSDGAAALFPSDNLVQYLLRDFALRYDMYENIP